MDSTNQAYSMRAYSSPFSGNGQESNSQMNTTASIASLLARRLDDKAAPPPTAAATNIRGLTTTNVPKAAKPKATGVTESVRNRVNELVSLSGTGTHVFFEVGGESAMIIVGNEDIRSAVSANLLLNQGTRVNSRQYVQAGIGGILSLASTSPSSLMYSQLGIGSRGSDSAQASVKAPIQQPDVVGSVSKRDTDEKSQEAAAKPEFKPPSEKVEAPREKSPSVRAAEAKAPVPTPDLLKDLAGLEKGVPAAAALSQLKAGRPAPDQTANLRPMKQLRTMFGAQPTLLSPQLSSLYQATQALAQQAAVLQPQVVQTDGLSRFPVASAVLASAEANADSKPKKKPRKPKAPVGEKKTEPENPYREERIVHPEDLNEADILFGRSKEAYAHVGNMVFRRHVRHYRAEYQESKNRASKRHVVKTIIGLVNEKGGRFLDIVADNDNKEIYVQVDYQRVYEKVSHALRSAKPHLPDLPCDDNEEWTRIKDEDERVRLVIEGKRALEREAQERDT